MYHLSLNNVFLSQSFIAWDLESDFGLIHNVPAE